MVAGASRRHGGFARYGEQSQPYSLKTRPIVLARHDAVTRARPTVAKGAMMNLMVLVQHWSVFRRGQGFPHGGNPCPVVTDAAGLRPAQMQAIAAHYGHESAFVTGAGAAGIQLRYFVPAHEVWMCVHATVAAVTALLGAGPAAGGETTAQTASGDHRVSWSAAGPPGITDPLEVADPLGELDRLEIAGSPEVPDPLGELDWLEIAGSPEVADPPNVPDPPEVTVELQAPSFGPPAWDEDETMAALGLPEESVAAAAPIRPVSVARPKLIVPLSDADAVHTARPDLPALWELCRRLDTTGAYIFAPHPDGRRDHFVARQFPVDAGYPEDPATGVAAAALAAYLADGLYPGQPAWARITIDQGDTMGRPSRLRAAALAGPGGIMRTSVTGRAVRTGQEELDLDALTRGRDLPEPELR